jgi:hypothetical protein
LHRAIGRAFGKDVEKICVQILRDAGYDAITIARLTRLGCTPPSANSALSTVYELFADTAENIAGFLFNVGFSFYDSVYEVYVIYNLGLEEVEKYVRIPLCIHATWLIFWH